MLEALQKSGITRRTDQCTDLGTLLIELLGNMRAEKSRGSGQQDSQRLSSPLGLIVQSRRGELRPRTGFADNSDHPELPTSASEGFEASIEMFAFMGGHVTGTQ